MIPALFMEEIRELQERSNGLLIDFLNTDLDLGFTFCETARIEQGFDPEGLKQAKEKVCKVIDVVRQFVWRVRDVAEQDKIWGRLEELESVFLAYIEPLR